MYLYYLLNVKQKQALRETLNKQNDLYNRLPIHIKTSLSLCKIRLEKPQKANTKSVPENTLALWEKSDLKFKQPDFNASTATEATPSVMWTFCYTVTQ